ncbi:MAG TPA: Ig-like domain-containing protein, partial [Acidimicrobiia bacterium]|nr:Ig-like domain-containing protein [Acidimicrobiia bacterium]
ISYGWGSGIGAAALGDEVVRRDQIGALDPATGTSLDWNPGSSAFEGVKALELHPRGLLVGQDGNTLGRRQVGRHGFFDFTRLPPPQPAEAIITEPFEGGTAAAGVTTRFEGRASALAGVGRVEINIQNLDNDQYLQEDGTAWGSYANIDVVLVTPGAAETDWSFDALLPGAGDYRIRARAIALDGTQSTWAGTQFEGILMDDAPPETRLTTPPSGLLNATTFLLGGTATDDNAVVRLSLFARNADNGTYLQDDGTIGPDWNTLAGVPDTPGEPNVTWSHEMTLPEGTWDVNVSAIDDANQSDIRGASRRYYVSATNTAPTATITSPLTGTVVAPGSTITIEGTAADDSAVRRVEVYVRNNQTREGMAVDGNWGVPDWHRVTPLDLSAPSTTWSVTTPPLPAGTYQVSALAVDDAGVTTPSSLRPSLTVSSAVAGDATPDTALSFAATTQDVDDLNLTITGTATDDRGVGDVQIIMRDSASSRYVANTAGGFTSAYTMIPATVASPGATATTFSITFDLAQAGDYSVSAIARDNAGQWDTSTVGATARYLIFPGDADPYLNLDSPLEGEALTDFVIVSGRAYDDVGVRQVQVMLADATNPLIGLRADGTIGAPQWIQAFVTNPGGVGSNYNYTTPNVPSGTYLVFVRAVDSVGQTQAVPNTATVTVTGVGTLPTPDPDPDPDPDPIPDPDADPDAEPDPEPPDTP